MNFLSYILFKGFKIYFLLFFFNVHVSFNINLLWQHCFLTCTDPDVLMIGVLTFTFSNYVVFRVLPLPRDISLYSNTSETWANNLL